MEGAMNITMLYQNDSIKRLVTEVLGWEDYTVTSTPDPAEALRVIEESAEPCLILTDNLKVNPVAHEALARLRANPELRKWVRVIGIDVDSVRQMELDLGILDDIIAMPFTVTTLLDSIEANFSSLLAK